jgi:hypothetical protein
VTKAEKVDEESTLMQTPVDETVYWNWLCFTNQRFILSTFSWPSL